MKKLSLFALAAAGLLLGACSSNDDVANVVQPAEEFEDGAFIGLSLQLPSADNTTRANDELSNGTEDEFAVKNATLYIFSAAKGETDPDANAKYVDYVTLGTTYENDKQGGIDPDDVWGVQTGVDETKITSTYSDAALIPNALASQIKGDTENDYYAYVIINHNGQVPAMTKGTTTFKDFSDTQFSEIGNDIAAKKNIRESGLLMTNAPICSVPGGQAAPAEGAKYTTLVKLDNNKIFGSKDEAKNNPAGCVYVERAAVKITVEDGLGTDPMIGTMPVSILGWQVINYEPTYYNTRHINNDGTAAQNWGPFTSAFKADANNKYRFVSLYKFEPTKGSGVHTEGYRTYFAKDPHYNADAVSEGTSALKKTVAIDEEGQWIAVGKTNHAYTTENTFDVDRMKWQNTTMVTLKVQIGDGTTGFYTVSKGGQTMYTTVDDAKAAIENIVKNDPAVTKAYNDLLNQIAANNPKKEVKAGMTVNFTAPEVGTTDVKFSIALAYTITDKSSATPTTTDADYAGDGEPALKTALETAIKNVIYSNPEETDASKLKTADAVLLSYYAGGVSFYNARIQHFGEAETPWSATGEYINGGGTTISEIYGTDATARTQNFLGRYGVVRDNWYKLSIDKIGKIGTAEPVDPSKTDPDTPDDEIENFISVHVHIVPWVLREQSVEF